MSSTWVDFKELRTRLRFADVLRSHNVELKIKGDRATGLCPLPNHPCHEGKRRTPSFSANLARGLFNCFGCHGHGNAIDFECLMSGGDPQNPAQLREAALRLQDRFPNPNGEKKNESVRPRTSDGNVAALPDEQPAESDAQQKPGEESARPVIVNAPLNFTLKMLDVEHPYLKQRGLTSETVSHFGLGYCTRGLMQGRIAIPLHDPQGHLIGYAGRLADETKISDSNPKYRFPGERDREGVHHVFQKSLFLYNGDALTAPVQDLVVVEGFASVWWLWQHGYHSVVALMGSSCSQEQATLIEAHVNGNGKVWIFSDGDGSGDRCAQSLFNAVAKRRFVKWVGLDAGHQPTDCDPHVLSGLLRRYNSSPVT